MSDQEPTSTPPPPPPGPPLVPPAVVPQAGFRSPGQAYHPPGPQFPPGTQFKPGTQIGGPRPMPKQKLFVRGMAALLAGGLIGVGPFALFILGGGGSTSRFMRDMTPTFIVAGVLLVLGTVLLVLNGIRNARKIRRAREELGGLRPGR